MIGWKWFLQKKALVPFLRRCFYCLWLCKAASSSSINGNGLFRKAFGAVSGVASAALLAMQSSFPSSSINGMDCLGKAIWGCFQGFFCCCGYDKAAFKLGN
nr:hypothetical protein Iba_chr07dCG9760 [Ipomoea batatas]